LETNDKNKSAKNSSSIDKGINKRIVEENKQKSKELPIYKRIHPN
jgi:hypothetical protein